MDPASFFLSQSWMLISTTVTNLVQILAIFDLGVGV